MIRGSLIDEAELYGVCVCVFNTAQFIDDSFTWGYGHFLSIDENIRFDELFPDEMRSEQMDQLGSQV